MSWWGTWPFSSLKWVFLVGIVLDSHWNHFTLLNSNISVVGIHSGIRNRLCALGKPCRRPGEESALFWELGREWALQFREQGVGAGILPKTVPACCCCHHHYALCPPWLLLLKLQQLSVCAPAATAGTMLWGCSCCQGTDSAGVGNDYSTPPKLAPEASVPPTTPSYATVHTIWASYSLFRSCLLVGFVTSCGGIICICRKWDKQLGILCYILLTAGLPNRFNFFF